MARCRRDSYRDSTTPTTGGRTMTGGFVHDDDDATRASRRGFDPDVRTEKYFGSFTLAEAIRSLTETTRSRPVTVQLRNHGGREDDPAIRSSSRSHGRCGSARRSETATFRTGCSKDGSSATVRCRSHGFVSTLRGPASRPTSQRTTSSPGRASPATRIRSQSLGANRGVHQVSASSPHRSRAFAPSGAGSILSSRD